MPPARNPAHQCYVYPDFDKASKSSPLPGSGRLQLDEAGGMGDFRGEQHPLSITVAFVYSGDSCIEIITPKPGCISAYNEFLDRHPEGGLHHIAYYAADFDKTLAMMKDAGKPLNVVVDMKDPSSGKSIEIYCEPVGVDDPVLVQLMRHGLFDSSFRQYTRRRRSGMGQDPLWERTRSPMKSGLARASRHGSVGISLSSRSSRAGSYEISSTCRNSTSNQGVSRRRSSVTGFLPLPLEANSARRVTHCRVFRSGI